MEPGKVVEFIEGQGFLTALVTRLKGAKILVLSETDREMNISQNRVLTIFSSGLNPSAPRNELIRNLKDISSRREALARKVDLREIWDLLEGEGEEFKYPFLAELAFPAPVVADHVAALQRAVFNDGVLFKMRPEAAIRNDAEKVEQITLTRAREDQRERELSEGGGWLSRVWAGDYSDEPDCGDRVIKVLRDMTINGSEAPEYKWGQRLLERAGLGADGLKPFYLLVKMGEMGLHENLDLARAQVPTSFSREVMAEAEGVARAAVWKSQERRDLTGLDVITADSGGARDFDDAVSLEYRDDRLVLGVHIADVSAVIHPGDLLDREALERTTSIYLPDRRIPMLPEILSEECLSLKVGEIRPAFSMLAELNAEGEALNFEFFPSLVRIKRQLSYQEVDSLVEHDPTLSRMFKLSNALKAQRTARGAMIIPLPKLNVFLTPEGEIGVNLTMWENPGRSMISEFMILANHLAARALRDKDAACLFRAQAGPSERLVNTEDDYQNLFLCLQQRRYLSRVAWGLEPAPHSGMGLDLYTNLTSPLRRYIDLIIQRQVRSVVNGGPAMYSVEQMSSTLTLVDATQKRANRLQLKRRRYWLLRYLEVQGRKEYEALVLEKLPHRWRIYLTELMMDADLPQRSGLNLKPGETVLVRIKKIDAREDILRLDMV
ncbi:MAG: RNB domain-containing ribonuclease [Pseudomonadota bacterium]